MRTAAPVLIAALACQACTADSVTGRVCTAIAVPALAITVLDASTGQRVCDATVVAVEGSFTSRLEPSLGGSEVCSYSGPYERAGVYEVRVTKDGYGPAVESNLRVSADECHVITRQLTVTLAR